jgi:hypothetical protein
MASFIARRAFSTTARRLAAGDEALKQETKRNPELMVRDRYRERASRRSFLVNERDANAPGYRFSAA